jgi:hypothetical protein
MKSPLWSQRAFEFSGSKNLLIWSLDDEARSRGTIAALVKNADLIDRDMRDLVIVVAQIKYAVSDIDDFPAINGAGTDANVDLFSHVLIQ